MSGTVSTLGSGLLTTEGPGEVLLAGTITLGLDSAAVQSGTLRLATAADIADIEVRSGGALSGDGGISGQARVLAGGRIEPGHGILPSAYGVFEAGSLVLATGSVTSFAIGGTNPGVTFDRAAVSGSATLAGTLDLRQSESFTPAVGDSFVVMTYGSRTGVFGALTSDVPLPPSSQWSIVYGAGTLTARVISSTAGVGDPEAPRTSGLGPLAPNPMRGTTTFSFELARAGRVDLGAFDASGRRVAAILSGAPYPAGRYSFTWSRHDGSGHTVPRGVYYIRLALDGKAVGEARKLVVSP